MKKILYVQHTGGMGGAPRSLAFLIEKLDKSKYEPIVLCLWGGPAVELLKKAGAKVIVDKRIKPFHGTTVSGMNLKMFIKAVMQAYPSYIRAKKIIKDINPDLVHLNTTCLFMVAKAAKKVIKDIKVITHVREPLLDSFAGKILRYMNHKYVDAYIAIDNYDGSKLDKRNRLFKVIYNFVDLKEYNCNNSSNILREELNIDRDAVVLLYLARIAKTNGTIEMVEAFSKRFRDDKNKHLVVVGDVPEDKSDYAIKVREVIKSTNNIHLVGFRNDIPNVIASSDIMIAPFIEPHFSRAIIEAGAMGKPSIASNVKGLDELVLDGETGLIFNSKNFETLCDQIIKLTDNDDYRRELGKNAQQFAYENFDIEKNSKDTFEVYETLIK